MITPIYKLFLPICSLFKFNNYKIEESLLIHLIIFLIRSSFQFINFKACFRLNLIIKNLFLLILKMIMEIFGKLLANGINKLMFY